VCLSSAQWVYLTSLPSPDTFTGVQLLFPSDLPQDSMRLHAGQAEVFMSDREMAGLRKDVKEVAILSNVGNYAKLRQGFVWRRKFNTKTASLEPESLQPICVCKQPLNPDFPYLICDNCGQILHEACVLTPLCPLCKAPCPFERSISPETPKKRPNEAEVHKKSSAFQVSKYPLLTPLLAIDLQKRLEKLGEATQALMTSLSEDTKVRYSFKDKVLTALMLAEAESRSQRGNCPPSDLKLMTKIAKEVESSVFLCAGKQIKSGNYIRRARTLVFNLLDEKNSELRGNLLSGQLKSRDLANLDSKELASSAMKKRREERERRYVEEQLIRPTEGEKLIVKSHKGEGIIDIAALHYNNGKDLGEVNFDIEEIQPESAPEALKAQPLEADLRKMQQRLRDIARENSPDVISTGIKRRLGLYLRPEQVAVVLQQAELAEK